MNNLTHSARIAREPAEGRHPPASAENGRDFRPADLLRILRGGIWTIAACVFLAMSLTVVLVLGATPRYVASAQMLLGEQGLSDRSTFDLVEAAALSNSVIEGELAVLKSNVLLVRVAQRLELDKVAEFNPALRAADDGPSPLAALEDWLKGMLGRDGAEGPAPVAPKNGIEIASGTGIEMLGAYKDVVGKLRESITVKQLGASFVVQVSAEAEDPAIASAITNALMDEYIDFLSDKRTQTAQHFTSWLETRVADLAVRLEKSERDVFEFRARAEADSESRDRLEQQMSELTTRLGEQRSALAEAEAMASEIMATMAREGALAAANLMSSETIIQPRAELSALRQRAATAASSFGEESPQVTSVNRSIALIEESISVEVQREIARLSNRQEVLRIVITSLEGELDKIARRTLDQSSEEIELNQLTRIAEANQQVYQQFLARFKELSEIQNFQVPDADVISYANPPMSPQFPRKKLSVALAGFGGLAAGFLLLLLRDMMPKRLQNVAQIAGAAELPVYGRMPRLGIRPGARLRSRAQLARGGSANALALAMQQLVNDADLRAGDRARSVVFTGPPDLPEKSALALMFGWAAAMKGRRCLVVDADLRGAGLTRMIEPPHGTGQLMKVLHGEAGLKDSVHALPEFGIDLLPTIVTGSDPAIVFSTEKFSQLMAAMLQSYDVVIFDTSGLADPSDAFQPVEWADLGLIVMPGGALTAAEIRNMAASARAAHLRNLGLVTTGTS